MKRCCSLKRLHPQGVKVVTDLMIKAVQVFRLATAVLEMQLTELASYINGSNAVPVKMQ